MYGVNAELFDTADEMCGPQRFDRRTKMVADGLGLKQHEHVAAGGVYTCNICTDAFDYSF